MMCPTCRYAGAVAATQDHSQEKIIYQNLQTGTQTLLMPAELAGELHMQCSYRESCTCHHIVEIR